MNKKAIMAAITLALLFLPVGIHTTELAKANPLPSYRLPEIKICSPLPNAVYPTNVSVYVKATVFSYTYNSWDTVVWLNYSLEMQGDYKPLALSYSAVDSDVEGSAQLANLQDGTYTLYVSGMSNLSGSYHYFGNQTTFTVDTKPPVISNLTVENKTYPWYQIPLNFSVNETPSWMGYSLDNQPNRTVTENTTITVYTEGAHTLEMYANDTAGNMGESGKVFFSMVLPTASPSLPPSPTPEPSPSPSVPETQIWVFLPLATVASLVLGYFCVRRRKP
jgi:hypothetical protein